MMNIYYSKLWRENLDTVIQTLPELCELEGKSVLITGATGLICSSIVDLLISSMLIRMLLAESLTEVIRL